MSTREMFLKRVERFLRRHKMSPTRFGQETLNDMTFVFELRTGRNPSADTIDKVQAWMREYTEAQKASRPSVGACAA